jgi:hypothetical protein
MHTFWSSRIVINLDLVIIAGPKLPKTIYAASLVPSPDGHGVILIGGYSNTDNAFQSSIYKLICDQLGCNWSEMKQQLQIARRSFVAMLIPDTLTNCTKT